MGGEWGVCRRGPDPGQEIWTVKAVFGHPILSNIVKIEKNKQNLMLHELKVGMILAEDMVGPDGESMLKEGTELTGSTLNLISYMSRSSAIEEPVAVLV